VARAGESNRLVVESPWPSFTSACQRLWHPPRLNHCANVCWFTSWHGGQATIAAALGVGLVVYWQLASFLVARRSHLALLGLLVATAVAAAL
jgi:hypothetical protein